MFGGQVPPPKQCAFRPDTPLGRMTSSCAGDCVIRGRRIYPEAVSRRQVETEQSAGSLRGLGAPRPNLEPRTPATTRSAHRRLAPPGIALRPIQVREGPPFGPSWLASDIRLRKRG